LRRWTTKQGNEIEGAITRPRLEVVPDEEPAERSRQEGPSGYTVGALLMSGRATITVEEAGKYLGIGRGAAYECVRNGEIPILHLGRRLLVPVPALMKMLSGE
jgi:excisionase family DNA binding protein